MKKRKFKKWVLYAIYILCMIVLFITSEKMGLISVYNNSIDITKLVIIILVYKAFEISLKTCYKREKNDTKNV